jgi:2-polyprenyl-3-methyl-5-hydroxy-6-metoxy-1,4-benzoquinol methylase
MKHYDTYYTLRNVSVNKNAANKIPSYILDLVTNKSSHIVDIGCGIGNMLQAFRENGYANIMGIDVSKQSVDHCLSKNLPVNLVNSIEDFTPKEDEKADLVIMSHVLEHLPKERIIDTLTHIRKTILKPGGWLYIAVPNAQSNTGCYWMYEDFTHYTLFTTGSLSFVLNAAGFSSVRYIDTNGLNGSAGFKKLIRKALLAAYIMNYQFWNKVTNSSFHTPSRTVFTFDLKALALNQT